MHILTKQQKIENLQEILAQKEKKQELLSNEIQNIRKKIEKLQSSDK